MNTGSPWLPIFIALGLLAVVAILFGLGRIAIIKSQQKESEKTKASAETVRANNLQKTLDDLQDRTQENQLFFETVRKLLIAQDAEQRQALIDQLRTIQFGSIPTDPEPGSPTTSTPTTSTTETTTITTSATFISSTTIAPQISRAPPATNSTTTTTSTTPPSKSPLKRICSIKPIEFLFKRVCS